MSDDCAACGGTGWEPIVDDGVRRVRRCEHCYAAKWQWAPGVPADERATTLAAYEKGGALVVTKANRDAVTHATYFVQGVHPDLYLFGGVGTGKTALACAVLNTLYRRQVGGKFLRVPELLNRLLPNAAEPLTLEAVAAVPVLVLDDVGASQGTDFARRTLQLLYDQRIAERRRTVWTSNLNLDDLAEFLGDERLPSRIAGQAKVIHLEGEDFRLRKLRERSK